MARERYPKYTTNGRLWDGLAAILLLAALLIASRRLLTTDWTDDLALNQTLTLLGCVSGLAILNVLRADSHAGLE